MVIKYNFALYFTVWITYCCKLFSNKKWVGLEIPTGWRRPHGLRGTAQKIKHLSIIAIISQTLSKVEQLYMTSFGKTY
jgi:hypothetical protein